MPDHDPVRFATDLSAKLATRSRHVCTFFGAGVGCSCGLPDIAKLQGIVLSALTSVDANAFKKQLGKGNLEQALSRLRRIAALLSAGQQLDDLSSAQATALDRTVCQEIVKGLEVKPVTDLTAVEYIAAWVGAAQYHQPVEIFTVNYDLLFETALERRRVPYFDGFVGTLKARFHTELVENSIGKDKESVPAFFVRLWKLHGSVNWLWETPDIVRLGQPVSSSLAAAIYPSDAKYDESRRVPFVVLQDRFRRALQEPETLVIISGYSFADEHLNELIFEAAARRQRSEFVAFCHSKIPDELSKRAINTPNLQVTSGKEAILGGVRGNWQAPTAPSDLWDSGEFSLRDFRKLAEYLARSAAIQPSSIGAAATAPSPPAAPATAASPSTTVT